MRSIVCMILSTGNRLQARSNRHITRISIVAANQPIPPLPFHLQSFPSATTIQPSPSPPRSSMNLAEEQAVLAVVGVRPGVVLVWPLLVQVQVVVLWPEPGSVWRPVEVPASPLRSVPLSSVLGLSDELRSRDLAGVLSREVLGLVHHVLLLDITCNDVLCCEC